MNPLSVVWQRLKNLWHQCQWWALPCFKTICRKSRTYSSWIKLLLYRKLPSTNLELSAEGKKVSPPVSDTPPSGDIYCIILKVMFLVPWCYFVVSFMFNLTAHANTATRINPFTTIFHKVRMGRIFGGVKRTGTCYLWYLIWFDFTQCVLLG